MTVYEELLEFGSDRIFEFLKNAKLHDSQFKYSEFNAECYQRMYVENSQDSICLLYTSPSPRDRG